MSNDKTIRVAAAQFYVGPDVEANLARCLHWLDQASACRPDLVVLPEFCNHLSWYDDKQHCFDVSVALDGPFLAAIAARAASLGIHVVVNCTVQRDDGCATGSSLLYGPDGKLLVDNTKQIYIGHENDFLRRAVDEGPVVASALGRVGLYSCMDGVIFEVSRCLALNGAQMILNSLNSFALDEASLHVPVRAAENKVYVVAANKVGPLVPEEMLPAISAATEIPETFLCGAGESQVVAPDGEVLAKASRDREEFVFADIEVGRADDKRRPDGTDIFASRRPGLYAGIVGDPAGQALPEMSGEGSVPAAVVQLAAADLAGDLDALSASLDEPLNEAVAGGARLIALPPLTGDVGDPQRAAEFGAGAVELIAARCGDAAVGTAVVLPGRDGGHRYLRGADRPQRNRPRAAPGSPLRAPRLQRARRRLRGPRDALGQARAGALGRQHLSRDLPSAGAGRGGGGAGAAVAAGGLGAKHRPAGAVRGEPHQPACRA